MQSDDKLGASRIGAGYAEFHFGFIKAAILLAFWGGFAVGAHSISVMGLGFAPGPGFFAFNQVHGQLQLMGWVGLFVMGISLFFLPRFAGVPLEEPHRQSQILWLMVSGLLLRYFSQSLLPYFDDPLYWNILGFLAVLSAFFILFAVALYVTTLLMTMHTVFAGKARPAVHTVAPFFAMMLAGWLLYVMINFALVALMVAQKKVVLPYGWNQFMIDLFVLLSLVPISFGVGLRTLPLYMRLPAQNWPVRRAAWVYLAGVAVKLLADLVLLLGSDSMALLYISHAGTIAYSAVVVLLIWKLDVLTRLQQPWTEGRNEPVKPDRKPTRPGMPDYGEFGAFEKLIRAAFFWLLFAAVSELTVSTGWLLGHEPMVSRDAVRHMYLMGFITHLIFGMAPRMIPGFLHKRAVARPRLVQFSYWLLLVAAVFRIIPLLLPLSLEEMLPVLFKFLKIGLSFSGVFAMLAVAVLWVNLRDTARS